jgi:uncharacterized PurR-regulated membrane protein YhhQ (DUF165 family)
VKLKIPGRLLLLLTLYPCIYILTPVLQNKQVSVFFLTLTGGMFISMFGSGIAGIVADVYGAKLGKKMVLNTVIARAVLYSIVFGIALLPATKETPGFQRIAVGSFRFFLAAQASAIIGKYLIMVPYIEKLKSRIEGFGTRFNITYNASRMVSRVAYVIIAHAGTGVSLLSVYFGTTFLHIGMALFLTPFFDWARRWVMAERDALGIVPDTENSNA